MAGLAPEIHVLDHAQQGNVDARDKPGMTKKGQYR
jgi:hypothetical protein